jgi:DNA-binding CsgD family transcriptional regulator
MYAVDVIPDGIQPIGAYRLWTYDLTKRGASLHSLMCHGIRPCPWEDAGPGWVVASCTGIQGHAAPANQCSCGVYAVASIPELLRHAVPFERGDGVGALMGRVELAGKVIEHERGYRAERARIVGLVPIEGATRDVMRYGNRLGIPISPAVPLPVAVQPSEREIKVIEMIASGSTTEEVAKSMGISRYSVERHLERAMDALRTPLAQVLTQVLAPWPPPSEAA